MSNARYIVSVFSTPALPSAAPPWSTGRAVPSTCWRDAQSAHVLASRVLSMDETSLEAGREAKGKMRAAGDARGNHRPLAAAAVHHAERLDRLAVAARLLDHHHRPHHVLAGLRGGHHPVAADRHGAGPGGGRARPRREATNTIRWIRFSSSKRSGATDSFRPAVRRRSIVSCPEWTSRAGRSSTSAAAPAGFRSCWRTGTAPPA